ncbi:MAG: S9 family peptidase [Alphaproteobacteria bacterium]
MRVGAIACAAWLALTAAALAQTPPPANSSAPPPVEAFGNLPQVDSVAMSPDGTRVAMALSMNGQPSVAIIDVQSGHAMRAAVDDKAELRSVWWADNNRVAFIVSRTFQPGQVLPDGMRFVGAPRRVDYFRNGVLDLASHQSRLLSVNNDDENQWQDMGSTLVAPIEGDDGYGRLIGQLVSEGHPILGVYRVNLGSGRSLQQIVQGANGDTLEYILDEHGAVAARVDSNDRKNRWRLYVYDNNRPRLLLEDVSDTGLPTSFEGLLPDNRIVALDTPEDGDLYQLFAIDRTNGQRTVLFARPGYEIAGAISDPWSRRVVGASWNEIELMQHYFDPDLQAAYEKAVAAFDGSVASLVSWSRDRRTFVVYAEEGLDGGDYYIFTLADNHIRLLATRYPDVAAHQGGAREAISYAARDGVRIPAYLTLPSDAHNLPLVVLVHGGPHGVRDTMDFDYLSAFLASRGYAVLQPNYRGSGGYGARWENAGHRQWGGLMQTDVEDGVAALVRNHIADPTRVCIVGASYGGYAALAGATLTPDRYRCAASIAGVSDLEGFLRQRESIAGDDSSTADFWRLSIGDGAGDRDHIRSVSPANLADHVHIPILLIHGTDDTVVPIDQSRLMRDRLRAAHKDVRYVELQGDDHYLSDASTRIQTLRELETFLAANLTTTAEAAPAH